METVTYRPYWSRVSALTAVLVLACGSLAFSPRATAGSRICEEITSRQIKGHDRAWEKLAGGRVVNVDAQREDDAPRYSYMSAVWPAGLPPLAEQWDYTQLRVQTKEVGTMHVLVEWKETNAFPLDQTDIDLQIYEMGKNLVGSSMVYNPAPEPLRTVAKAGRMRIGDGVGGPGWEYAELKASACVGYLIETNTWSSEQAEKVSVKVWLSD